MGDLQEVDLQEGKWVELECFEQCVCEQEWKKHLGQPTDDEKIGYGRR